MRLSQLQQASGLAIHIYEDREIHGAQISRDSHAFQAGQVFVAIRGQRWDGHSFIDTAIERGAALVVFEDPSYRQRLQQHGINHLHATCSRKALAQILASLNQRLNESIQFIGITGTNGKTSISHFIEQGFALQQQQIGVLGTIDHHYGDTRWPTELTSPGALELQTRIQQMYDLGARSICMEVSSHALHQHRVDAITFAAAVFTNLSQDHLDYHLDMESYFAAKRRLFTELLRPEGFCVFNGDCPFASRLQDLQLRQKKFSFGKGEHCSYRYQLLQSDAWGSDFVLVSPRGRQESLHIALPGLFSIENFLAALVVLDQIWPSFCWQDFARSITAAPGRLQRVPNDKGVHAFVDFAHSPDALEKVLLSLRSLRTGRARIGCVFGAGGDRDASKRAVMAEACERVADFAIVTSDNPRSEDPAAISEQICAGFSTPYRQQHLHVQLDRRRAIELAVSMTKPGDILLVAGKGHETYQEIAGKKYDFDDRLILAQALGG